MSATNRVEEGLVAMSAKTLAEALAKHNLTTPVQCACGWRETDGHGETHAEHVAARLIASGAVRPAAKDAAGTRSSGGRRRRSAITSRFIVPDSRSRP